MIKIKKSDLRDPFRAAEALGVAMAVRKGLPDKIANLRGVDWRSAADLFLGGERDGRVPKAPGSDFRTLDYRPDRDGAAVFRSMEFRGDRDPVAVAIPLSAPAKDAPSNDVATAADEQAARARMQKREAEYYNDIAPGIPSRPKIGLEDIVELLLRFYRATGRFDMGGQNRDQAMIYSKAFDVYSPYKDQERERATRRRP